MNGRDIAQMAVMVAMWVIVIVLILSLWGCLGLEGLKEERSQSLKISADCEENTIDVFVDDIEDDHSKNLDLAK